MKTKEFRFNDNGFRANWFNYIAFAQGGDFIGGDLFKGNLNTKEKQWILLFLKVNKRKEKKIHCL